jgi:hypothetical protein
MGQNVRLLAELWKRRRSKAANELILVLHYELLRIVCGMIWDMYLLKTSILVTKTPWTTLRCLYRKYVGCKRASARERYLTLLTVPSILILANLLNQKRLSTRKISLLVITFLLISSVIFVNYSTWRKNDYDLEEAILYLKTLPEKNIWASIVTAFHIRFQYQYQRDHFIKSFSNPEDLTGIHDSYVVVSYGIDGDVKLPKESANWKLIKVVENPYSASRYNTTIYYVGGFYVENLGPPPPTGKWRVGDLVVFSGFLFEDSTPVEGVTVTAKFSFDRASWTNIGTSVTALDGIWEVWVDAIPKEWAGRTVYFRAEANEDQSSIVSLFVNMEK